MRGVREIIRAPLFDPARVMGAVRRALSSPRLVRWGAVALVLAGALGLTADALYLVAVYRLDSPYAYPEGPLIALFFILRWMLGSFLICLGLLGLHALLSGAGTLPRRLALSGAALALTLAALVLWDSVRLWLSPLVGYSPTPTFLLYGLHTGILLSGVAALWARGLGRWRFLPPVVLSMPLVAAALWFYLDPYSQSTMIVEIEFKKEALIASPQVAADAGLILFGLVLFGAKKREAALLATERREMEERNLALARRLYEEAWGKADLPIVDELVAPDFFDHRRGRGGPEEFKRAITDLHHTFQDLSLSIEEQTAEGDTVTTHCNFSGTDRGGVLWYPPTGKHASFGNTYVDRFSDGKLVEHRGGSDPARLLEQLGLASAGDG